MNSTIANGAKTRRDFIFFVNGISDEMVIHHEQYTFASVGEDQRKQIVEISKHSQGITNWLSKTTGRFHAAIFRNEHTDESDAFSEAFDRLSGILDGFAFLIEDAQLAVCPMVAIRERDAADAQIKLFGHRAWVAWGTPTEHAEKAWQARKEWLLNRFLIYFDAVASGETQYETEIANQLELSAKMFRYGGKSDSYGIEFLCKFTALEGLVCGPAKFGKEKLLRERLSALFRTRNGIEAEISKLWKMRCEASHQGKAFTNDFSSVIEPLERLTLGVIVFALDHLQSEKTFDALWNRVGSYSLPSEVLLDHPKHRAAVVRMMGEFGIWKGAGILTDNVFDQLSKIFQNRVTSEPK